MNEGMRSSILAAKPDSACVDAVRAECQAAVAALSAAYPQWGWLASRIVEVGRSAADCWVVCQHENGMASDCATSHISLLEAVEKMIASMEKYKCRPTT